MFEVAGTELEDIVGAWLYRWYARHCGPWPGLTDGVVEEVWAAWREVEYARRAARKHPGLRGYTELVSAELRGLPAGYRDFDLMRRHGSEVRSAVASLMLAGPGVATGRWGQPAGREADNMPLYWIGQPDVLRNLGGFERVVSLPSIRDFEKWLRLIGATILPSKGKGSHRKVRLPNGRVAGYATSARQLLWPEANQIARELNLAGTNTLLEYVRDKRELPG